MKQAPIFFSLLLFLLFQHKLDAQLQFQKVYGGQVNAADEGFSADRTADNGFILGGATGSYGAGQMDAWLMKTDAFGSLQWSASYGGSGYEDILYVRQLPDHGYAFCGETFSYGAGNGDAYLARTDSNGVLLWMKTYGRGFYDVAYAFDICSDGGFIISGLIESTSQNYDALLIKTDASGDTTWTKIIGGPGVDHGVGVLQTSDGGYAFTGKVLSYGAGLCDIFLVKTDAAGDTLWTSIVGGTGWDEGISLRQTTDGGFAVCGGGNSYGSGNYDFYLARYTAAGALSWMKAYGGNKIESAYGLRITNDSGYVFTGYTETYGPGHMQQDPVIPPDVLGTDSANVFVIRTDAQGDTLWSMTYGGLKKEESFWIDQLPDLGYAIAGYTSSFANDSDNFFLVRTDAAGRSSCNERAAHPVVTPVNPVQTHAASPVSAGMQVSAISPSQAAASPLVTVNCLVLSAETANREARTVRVFPNPVTDIFKIEGLTPGEHRLELRDISGRLVLQTAETEINIGFLNAGCYLLCIDGDSRQLLVKTGSR